MRICGVIGDDPQARSTLAERLVQHFGRSGPVAHVTRSAAGRSPASTGPGASTTLELGAEGRWSASGTGASLDALIADLSPDHDTVVLEGFQDADVPQVVLGEVEHDGQLLLDVDAGADVDPTVVADALEETEPFETLESLVAAVKRTEDADRGGAIATFTGRVRERDHEADAPTTHLEFEKYEGIAEERLAALEDDLEAREGVYAVRLHHRTGAIEAGEDIVFVVVLAGHRDEAFRTARDGIDRLKEEVPIFKKEITAEETFWVHDRQ